MKTKTKAKTQLGEPAREARSAPSAGCFTHHIFAFVFVLILYYFIFVGRWPTPPPQMNAKVPANGACGGQVSALQPISFVVFGRTDLSTVVSESKFDV